ERRLVGRLLDGRLAPQGRCCLETGTPLLWRRLASVAVRRLPVQQSPHAPDLSHHLRTALSLPPARSVGAHDSGRLRLAPLRAQDPPECAREPRRARRAPLPERDNLLFLGTRGCSAAEPAGANPSRGGRGPRGPSP